MTIRNLYETYKTYKNLVFPYIFLDFPIFCYVFLYFFRRSCAHPAADPSAGSQAGPAAVEKNLEMTHAPFDPVDGETRISVHLPGGGVPKK